MQDDGLATLLQGDALKRIPRRDVPQRFVAEGCLRREPAPGDLVRLFGYGLAVFVGCDTGVLGAKWGRGWAFFCRGVCIHIKDFVDDDFIVVGNL